jgi:glycosyltransferase involved in cell wall biosynthesis
VFLQHEYGIFGHSDGQGALDLLTQLEVPVISTLHSVPLRPTSRQKIVLEEVVGHSAAVVTMTEVARQRLFGLYEVDESKIMTIPHGATIPPNAGLTSAQPPLLLTWGLLGPGKGIEWVLQAIALIKDEVPNFRYLVAGQTHPNIVRDSGEAYREMLQAKVQELGIGSIVQFDASYKPLGSLLDQITSGVLVDAIAASKPVIATQFSHAVELLSGGAGILVPPQNPEEMSRAIKRVLHHPEAVVKMAGRAAQLAPLHTWSTVARQYSTIVRRVTFNSKIGVAS